MPNISMDMIMPVIIMPFAIPSYCLLPHLGHTSSPTLMTLWHLGQTFSSSVGEKPLGCPLLLSRASGCKLPQCGQNLAFAYIIAEQ